MDDESKFIGNAKYVLRQYGIDASDYVGEIIDIGPDNVSLILAKDINVYFLAADDYLSDDDYYIAQAKAKGIGGLTPMKLLSPDTDGEYVTMYDNFMACKAYRCEMPSQ